MHIRITILSVTFLYGQDATTSLPSQPLISLLHLSYPVLAYCLLHSCASFPVWLWMRSSASTGCECARRLFSRSPFWPIGLYMAIPRSTYDSSQRSPTSRPDKDCGLQPPTSYVFLLLDCLLLDIAPSLSPVLANGTTYRLMSPQHHLCSPLEND